MTRINMLGTQYKNLNHACTIAVDEINRKVAKRDRHGGKQKFNYGKPRKRQRRHINNRLANQECRKFDW